MGKGTDVYLFLIGMMLLSAARREGCSTGVAAAAVNRAGKSPKVLFLSIYAVGVVITAPAVSRRPADGETEPNRRMIGWSKLDRT